MDAHVPAQPRCRPRKGWVAGLLALVSPGLGHVYGGRAAVGIAFLVGPWLFALVLAAAVWADTGVLATAAVLALVGPTAYVAQVVWAVNVARRSPAEYRLQWYNHFPVYVAYFVAVAFVANSGVIGATVIESFRVPAGSMVPSLLEGDQFFAARIGERNRVPHRGDVVVLRSPAPAGGEYVKRVIGLPGDEIAVAGGGTVMVNGTPIRRRALGRVQYQERAAGQWRSIELQIFEENIDQQTYLVAHDPSAPHGSSSFGPIRVPEGHFFVMGDSRDRSIDSRDFGPVPLGNHVGRAHSVWFSWGPDGLRPERLGLHL